VPRRGARQTSRCQYASARLFQTAAPVKPEEALFIPGRGTALELANAGCDAATGTAALRITPSPCHA